MGKGWDHNTYCHKDPSLEGADSQDLMDSRIKPPCNRPCKERVRGLWPRIRQLLSFQGKADTGLEAEVYYLQ